MNNPTAEASSSDISQLPACCIICDAIQWQPALKVLQQCGNCGFIRADLQIDRAELEALYQESYFRGDEYGDYLADREVHRRNFQRRLTEIRKQLGTPKSVYEIGCAYGLWLEVVSEHKIPARGIDICQGPVQYARDELKMDATCGDFLTAAITPAAHDLFCMWDTIEHLPRPELFVERIYELLPSGGTFVFTTGDIGSRYARWQGARWRMIHPPTHLHYFSKKSARQLLEKHGFQMLRAHSIGIYRNLHSVLGALEALKSGWMQKSATAAGRVLPNWFQRCGGWVNLGDIMIVMARKP
jgi:SAM-dependent methyltransferase